ncbi:MAG: hypothetical protein GF329_06565 [Candidatus Lokiarchaeota archaeon]|nr:hypothetical protein [Candidatus Lokiarchaeota archaeon]
MTVHNLYIYSLKTGICLVHEKVGSLSVDQNILTSEFSNLDNLSSLIAPFLSGVNNLDEKLKKSDQIGIKSLELDKYRICFENGKYIQLAMVVDYEDDTKIITSVLKFIIKEFETRYDNSLEQMEGISSTNRFNEFNRYCISRIYNEIYKKIKLDFISIFNQYKDYLELDKRLEKIIEEKKIPIDLFFKDKYFRFTQMWDDGIFEMRNSLIGKNDLYDYFPDARIDVLKIDEKIKVNDEWFNPYIRNIWDRKYNYYELSRRLMERFSLIVKLQAKYRLGKKILYSFSEIYHMYEKSLPDIDHKALVRKIIDEADIPKDDKKALYSKITNNNITPKLLGNLKGMKKCVRLLEKYLNNYDILPIKALMELTEK